MLYIAVPDMHDSMSTIVIDGKEYILRFTYNEFGDYWSFGIYTNQETPIVAMVKIVPNFPLLHFYSYSELPEGTFGAVSKEERISRDSFRTGKAKFVYVSEEETRE